jgi:hypothetical protein
MRAWMGLAWRGGLALACCASSVYAQRSGDERAVDTAVSEPIPRNLSTPDVAFGEGLYLLVWIEQRLGGTQPVNQLLGARVTPEGQVLDARGFAVATAAALRREPRVVAASDGFVVLWRESRHLGREETRFARVSVDGRVLDPEGVPLPSFDAQELGCAGASCLTVSSPVSRLRTLGFDHCGTLGAEHALEIPPRTSSQSGPTVTPPRLASDACGHWLAFGQHDEQTREMSIALFGFEPDGQMRFGTTLHRLAAGTTTPPVLDLAANGAAELLVVWQQQVVDAAGGSAAPAVVELWSQRVDAAGAALSDARRLTTGTSPALGFTGSGYLLVSGDEVLSAQRLDEAGAAVEAEPVVIRAQPRGLRGPARLAAGPDGALVVWEPKSTTIAGERNVARLSREGELLDPDGLAVAATANRQRAPELAPEGDGYRLLFHDDRPDRPGLLGVRLDARARPLGASASVLPRTFAPGDEPRLHAVGTQHALIWPEGGEQLLSWLDPSTQRASETTRLAIAAPAPRGVGLFVPGSESILAVGQHAGRLCGEDQPCDVALSIQLLHLDGSADAARPAVMLGPDGELAHTGPVAAFDGRGFVLAYTETRVAFGQQGSDLRAVRVGPDGSVVGEPHLVSDTPDGSHDEVAAVAATSTGALLVLMRLDASSSLPRDQALYAVRLGADAVAIDPAPFPLASRAAERSHVRVVDDGEAWIVVWQERADQASWDIRGAWVPREVGSQAATFGVAVSPLDELVPALAATAPNHAVVAYERFDANGEVMTGRVFLRDLLGTERCADPDCCDDACRVPEPDECEPASQDEQACNAIEALDRTARYDCGCSSLGGTRPRSGALLVVALLAVAIGTTRAARQPASRRSVARVTRSTSTSAPLHGRKRP